MGVENLGILGYDVRSCTVQKDDDVPVMVDEADDDVEVDDLA